MATTKTTALILLVNLTNSNVEIQALVYANVMYVTKRTLTVLITQMKLTALT